MAGSVRSLGVSSPPTGAGPASAPSPGPLSSGTVLLAGDIAGVAATQAAALAAHTRWVPRAVAVAGAQAGSRLARAADLPRRAGATRRAVRDGVRRWRPDIVHLHWARYAPFLDTRGRPLVVQLHGSDVRGRGSTVSGRLVHRSLRRAAAVVASTPDLVDDVPEARYLPNPIDLDVFTPGAGTGQAAAPDRPTVLLFARLDPVKGAATLVAIAAELRRRRPDVRLVGVAGGRLDAEAVAVGVELAGPRGAAAVADLLREADVVVGQQHLGALGLSELEAMACGRPVIAPVRAELYDADLPVVRASGAVAAVDACLELLDDEGRRAVAGADGRRYVAARHDPAAVAAALTRIYAEAVR